jgi:beta-ureidopropionase / N-carbamoyl-L-amino-acid hydrolase
VWKPCTRWMIIVFQNEENGSIGSRAITLGLNEALLEVVSQSGKTTRDGIAFIGGNPDELDVAIRQPGEVFTYLELHIEQGGVLDSDGVQISLVDGIFVNRIVTSVPGPQVATVGRIEAFPGVPNVIPGRVELTLEMRGLDRPKVEGLFRRIQETAQGEISASTGTTFAFEEYHDKLPARTNSRLQALLSASADELDLTSMVVPSVGGISHAPGEYSSPQDITNGVNVLLQGVLKADRAAIPPGHTPG